MERLNKRENAKLFDKPIGYIEDALAEKLPWLDHIFGRSERLLKVINNKRYYTPNWYKGNGEYLILTPDQNLGCYAFFVIEDPQTVDWAAGLSTTLSTPFSLIVWADMRLYDNGHDWRDTEAAKEDILRVLNGGVWMREGGFTITRIYERAENVFRGYTMDEVDNQFLMSPFAGWRFDGLLTIKNECI